MFENFLQQYWLLLAIGFAVFAILCLFIAVRRRNRMPYVRRPRLVTNTELKFYHRLRKAVRGDFAIFAMVRIADLLTVEKGNKKRRSWLNRILSKHVDFVICDHKSLQPVVAIELDDRSHSRPDRVERDEFVNSAFETAGLPLLRIPVADDYDDRQLRSMIARTAR